MAMHVLITTDTEMSSALHESGVSVVDNFRLCIEGLCDTGRFGIHHQMDMLEDNGLKGVFFIDPMPGLVDSSQVVADMVGPVVSRGHEVQLHIHTEWLDHVKDDPVAGARGRNIGDFSLQDQTVLLGLARDMLVEAGAPPPTAFRAGNYGSNDDTLRALATLGIRYDSSFNAAYVDSGCDISLCPTRQCVTEKDGISIVPVSTIEDPGGAMRPAQLCALSAEEMGGALDHARRGGADFFNIVSHSFELIVRDTQRPNPIMVERFDRLCAKISGTNGLRSSGFDDLSGREKSAPILPVSRRRYLRRMGEQLWSRFVHEGAGPLPPLAAITARKPVSRA